MNNYQCTRIIGGGADGFFARRQLGVGPVKKFFGHWSRGVDAAVAHGSAEIAVPVCAVDADIPVEKHSVRDVGKIIIRLGARNPPLHLGGADFVPDMILTGRSPVPQTGADGAFQKNRVAVVSGHFLV